MPLILGPELLKLKLGNWFQKNASAVQLMVIPFWSPSCCSLDSVRAYSYNIWSTGSTINFSSLLQPLHGLIESIRVFCDKGCLKVCSHWWVMLAIILMISAKDTSVTAFRKSNWAYLYLWKVVVSVVRKLGCFDVCIATIDDLVHSNFCNAWYD